MSFKSRIRESWRDGAIGAGLAVVLGFAFGPVSNRIPVSEATRKDPTLLTMFLERLSYDLSFRVRPPVAIDSVVAIQIDDASYRALNQTWGQIWDRSLHARLLDHLNRAGAKLVVFDVLFADPVSPEKDQDLAAAIKSNGRVVLAATLNERPRAQVAGQWVERPRREFLEAAHSWGLAEVIKESDRGVRLIYPGTDLDPALPWVAAQAIGAPVTRNAAHRFRERWLNFYGHKMIPAISYWEATNQPPEFYRDKVVFIGGKPRTVTVGEESDEFRVPSTRWDDQYEGGLQIHATSFLNLLRGDWLERMNGGIELVILLAGGALAGFGLALVRPIPAACLTVGACFMIALLGVTLVWIAGVWFPWLICCAVQLPAALGWSVLAYSRRLLREKKALEESLSRFRAGAVPFVPGPDPLPASVRDEESTLPDLLAAIGPSSVKPPFVLSAQAFSPSSGGSDEFPSVTAPPIPNHVMLRPIGEGAYGEVWLARDELGLCHAVKVVYRNRFSTKEPFEREFRGLQAFAPISRNHAGLVHILHAGKNDPKGYFFYIMELGDSEDGAQPVDPIAYRAKTLASELRARRRISVSECVRLTLHLTAALDYLHRQQLIHRDIKPSNIIFVNGLPKFADIGLVRSFHGDQTDVSYVGTAGYMAPEGPGSPQSDIFSLGKVIYEACMGRNREDFPALPDTLSQRSDFAQLIQLNTIILKACDPRPAKRYPSAAAMHTDLLRIQQQELAPAT